MTSIKRSVLSGLGTLLAIGVVLSFSTTAHALPAILTMTPSVAKPTVNPGSAIKGNFQVVNGGKKSYVLAIYAAPYSVIGENYTPDFQPIPNTPNVTSWLHFSVTNANVPTNHTLNVNYTLSVPKGTPPGGYYAVAFAKTVTPKTTTGVAINEQIGEVFYIRVAGPVKQAGKLLTWSVPFLQKPPANATLRLEDSGSLHYASNIHVVVSDTFGHPKYTLTTQKEILPFTIRRVPVAWTNAPALGLFKVSGSVTVLNVIHNLPTKYILVMSQPVRTTALVILAVIVCLSIVRLLIRRKVKTVRHRTVPRR